MPLPDKDRETDIQYQLKKLSEDLGNLKSQISLETKVDASHTKVQMSMGQVWSLILIVFAIAGSYTLTVSSVNVLKGEVRELKDGVRELKDGIKQLDASIKDQNDIFEYLIIQDTTLIKKLPPRLKQRFQ